MFNNEIHASLVTFVILWSLSHVCLGQEGQEGKDAFGRPFFVQDGVRVKILKKGKECTKWPCECTKKATAGDHLKVHYEGRFDDENGKIFDTSRQRNQLYGFQLGAGQVISVANFIANFSQEIGDSTQK